MQPTALFVGRKDMSEKWAPINGWPYEASDQGRIRRIKTQTILAPYKGRGDRPKVTLYRPGGRRMFFVHSLVLDAFLCPRPEGMQCNHKNGVISDNRLCNLEWVTPGENMKHAEESGLLPSGTKHWNCKLTEEQAREIYRRAHSGKEQLQEIANDYGIVFNTVWEIKSGRNWSCLHKNQR